MILPLVLCSVVAILLQVLPCPTELLLQISSMVLGCDPVLLAIRMVRFLLKQTPIGPRKTKPSTRLPSLRIVLPCNGPGEWWNW